MTEEDSSPKSDLFENAWQYFLRLTMQSSERSGEYGRRGMAMP